MSAAVAATDLFPSDLPDAALAMALTEATSGGLLFVDATGARLESLAATARAMAPEIEVLALPAWDSLPFDRTPASPAVIGQRVHALARIADAPALPRLVLTSARALLQRVPAPSHWRDAALALAVGAGIELDTLRTTLATFGYHVDEHVDRPGEVAIRGPVIDVFPGDAEHPVRIELLDGVVTGLHRLDPISQRSVGPAKPVVLRPVVEGAPVGEGEEHRAVDVSSLVATLFDYLGRIPTLIHPDVPHRLAEIEQEVASAYEAAYAAARSGGRRTDLPKAERLILGAKKALQALDRLPAAAVAHRRTTTIPAARDLSELAAQLRAADAARLVVCAPDPGAVAAKLKRRGAAPEIVALSIREGFRQDGLAVLAAPPLRPAHGPAAHGLLLEEPPRLSDIVVHAAHGVCRLGALRQVGGEDRLALAFHEGTELLAPMAELAQLWRYGSEAGHIPLDRLHGQAWHKRRAEIEAEIEHTAASLAEATAQRRALTAPVIEPPARTYDRVVERFRFTLSPDQASAIEAVLADLRSGRPMDRLLCGDVGFGKTEVALRAAAATALAGHQVALVAPTTVLARQHLDTLLRRLDGTGLRVEPLLRGATGASAKAVRDGLADGSIDIVVGTQAIASDKVSFKALALVVIDEEQRFGDADKRKLTRLRDQGTGVHTLVMTATPIPRTLQAALVGLRDVSVIATAPTRRQPTRTFVLPFGDVILREALLREQRGGGQSFVVVPRIEELDAMAAHLRAWTPGLTVAIAHGKLKPEVLEERVGRFAAGDTDVLLATNIIEAGLDIPRANTIVITGPHRFGLAQLHQMRGRVGRGAQRGMAYVLTDPAHPLAGPTAQRLRTLETLEGLGAGVAIAAADLDARGAGDLFGERQAGHVHAIGTELYQDLLMRALARIEGRAEPPPWPMLHLGVEGRIPESYVPEPNLRLELYRRLARVDGPAAADELASELADRFGPIPPTCAPLLDEARLRGWCVAHGVTQVGAGPKATALTVPGRADALAARLPGAAAKGDRVLLPAGGRTPAERLAALLGQLTSSED